MVSWLSSTTPRSLTTDENGTVAFGSFSIWTLSSCWQVPSQMICVFVQLQAITGHPVTDPHIALRQMIHRIRMVYIRRADVGHSDVDKMTCVSSAYAWSVHPVLSSRKLLQGQGVRDPEWGQKQGLSIHGQDTKTLFLSSLWVPHSLSLYLASLENLWRLCTVQRVAIISMSV